MSRRDKLTMIRDTLLVCENGGTRLTGIVYGANLNFTIVRPIMDQLIKRGLLEKLGEYYLTTTRGQELIALINEAQDILGPECPAITQGVLV